MARTTVAGRRCARRCGSRGLGSDQVILPLLDDSFELRASGIETKSEPAERRIDLRQATEDWHNLYADFSIRLSGALGAAETDGERLALVQAVRAALDAKAPKT